MYFAILNLNAGNSVCDSIAFPLPRSQASNCPDFWDFPARRLLQSGITIVSISRKMIPSVGIKIPCSGTEYKALHLNSSVEGLLKTGCLITMWRVTNEYRNTE